MSRRTVALMCVLSLCLAGVLTTARAAQAWKTYKGAWFAVKYPAGFTVTKREANGAGFDGASFTSPDGRVEFYVFSPQWWGKDPVWTQLKAGEKLVDTKTEGKGNSGAKWVTLSGPKGAYERSYLVKYNKTLNTRHVFGYKYRNRAAYNAYKADYARFKGSLVQYAD